MSAEASTWIAKYRDVVVTAVDADGYPVSVRRARPRYDGINGIIFELPDALRIKEGPANMLCHSHDEDLLHLSAIQVKGRLRRAGSTWVFVITAFTAPPSSQLVALWHLASSGRGAARRYLDKRGLGRPQIDWIAIRALQRRARSRRSASRD